MKYLPSVPTSTHRLHSSTVRSDDGTVSFTLASTASGLFVERVQLRRGTARVVQSALFPDERSFKRWCEADPVKFEYPLVYMCLRRDGDALLRS